MCTSNNKKKNVWIKFWWFKNKINNLRKLKFRALFYFPFELNKTKLTWHCTEKSNYQNGKVESIP